MTLDRLNSRALLQSLTESNLCPACLDRKRIGQTFCRHCYIALPRELSRALWRRIGAGYLEAVKAAMTQLGKTEFHLSKPEPQKAPVAQGEFFGDSGPSAMQAGQ